MLRRTGKYAPQVAVRLKASADAIIVLEIIPGALYFYIKKVKY